MWAAAMLWPLHHEPWELNAYEQLAHILVHQPFDPRPHRPPTCCIPQ